jgi:ParB family transcriptional regulator, chromosome partitioning protein
MNSFKTFGAYLRRADENTVGRALVESAILLAASRGNASLILARFLLTGL